LRHSRNLALLLVVLTTSSCAYFLSPDQRGNRGGTLDAPALAGDILWLIPGIIPGIVALAVDFSSGAVYKNPETHVPAYSQPKIAPHAMAPRVIKKGTHLTVRPPVVDRPTRFSVRIVSGGRTVADFEGLARPGDGQARLISLAVPATLPRGSGGELQLVVDGKLEGRVPCTFR
jgi:hypothetical protein